ncbi:unnamed protein product [Effrenium voratum]|uniref:Uncharacterized protein n=1 Tax=Effrenium voratum TaxID=2562239 RepID=A0AA36IRQ9_9DINO|nr:unnamed protein product [Effrenium voratum]
MDMVSELPISDRQKQYIAEVLNPIVEDMITDCVEKMPQDCASFMQDWLITQSGIPMSDRQQQYIAEVLNPILEDMVADCVERMPKDCTSFMQDWLRSRAEDSSGLKQLTELRKDIASFKEELAAMKAVRSDTDLANRVDALEKLMSKDLELRAKETNGQEKRRESSAEAQRSAQPNTGMPTAQTAQTGQTPQTAQTVQMQTDQLPKTYEEALEQLGGQEELAKTLQLSKDLQQKHGLAPEITHMLPLHYSERISFSVKLNYQPYQTSLGDLMHFCKVRKPLFDQIVQDIAEDSGGKPIVPPVKGEKRCGVKANFKYKDSQGGIAWHRLTDVVRATIIYERLEDMYNGLKMIDRLHDEEKLKIIELNDRYMTPLKGGYRDIQLCLSVNELVCELQLNSVGMAHVKEHAGHRAFEVARELAAAIEEGSLERCRSILDWGKVNLGKDWQQQLVAILNDPSKPLLHQAARVGNSDLMEVFLEYKADVSFQQVSDKMTALHEAMTGGHERAAWLLLSRKADPELPDATNRAPLMLGLLALRMQPDSEPLARCVTMLVQKTCDGGLHHLHEVKERLQAFVKEKMQQSSQLLTFAGDGNLVEVQRLLREEFADPNSRDAQEKCPMHVVLESQHAQPENRIKIMQWLVQFEADLEARDKSKRSVLAFAVASRDGLAFQVLIRAGIRLGNTALRDQLSAEDYKEPNFNNLVGRILTTDPYSMQKFRDAGCSLQDMSPSHVAAAAAQLKGLSGGWQG